MGCWFLPSRVTVLGEKATGTIQIQPAPGFPVAVPPLPLVSGVIYSSVLPAGFIQPGRYTISGTPGGAVTLNLTATVGAPIQITSSFPAGSGISASQPVTVQWTGGDSLSLVRVALISGTGAYNYSYAPASAGSDRKSTRLNSSH